MIVWLLAILATTTVAWFAYTLGRNHALEQTHGQRAPLSHVRRIADRTRPYDFERDA